MEGIEGSGGFPNSSIAPAEADQSAATIEPAENKEILQSPLPPASPVGSQQEIQGVSSTGGVKGALNKFTAGLEKAAPVLRKAVVSGITGNPQKK